MLKAYLEKNLDYDESVLHIIRPSWKRYVWRIVRNCFLIIAAFFLMYPLFTFGKVGVIIFVSMASLGVLGLAATVLMRQAHAAIITNKRLIDIDQRSLFQRSVAECPLENIQDIRYNTKGILAVVCKTGNVIIDSGHVSAHIELQDVKYPEQVKSAIINTQRNRTKSSHKIQEKE